VYEQAQLQQPTFPTIDVSESRLLPPLTIVAESEDRKMYKIEIMTPRGLAHILMRTTLFTPLQNGNLTVLRADAIEILE
jgi:hypothetical protein